MRRQTLVALVLVILTAGCLTLPETAHAAGPAPPVSPPSHLCWDPSLEDDDFCLPVERVDAMDERIRELLERVDAGEIATF